MRAYLTILRSSPSWLSRRPRIVGNSGSSGCPARSDIKGRRRVEADRFVALRSHYLFESEFTRAGKEGAHEKGGVEGDVGRFRRSYLVPVPQVDSLAELNDRIGGWCIEDLGRTIRGRSATVGEALGREGAAAGAAGRAV